MVSGMHFPLQIVCRADSLLCRWKQSQGDCREGMKTFKRCEDCNETLYFTPIQNWLYKFQYKYSIGILFWRHCGFLLSFNHTVFTLLKVWKPLHPLHLGTGWRDGGTPHLLFGIPFWQNNMSASGWQIKRKKMTSRRVCRLLHLCLFWAPRSRHPLLQECPLPVHSTSPSRAAQSLVYVSIYPLSIPSLSTPLSRTFSASLSTSCSSRGDVAAAGLQSSFCHGTMSISCSLRISTISDTCPIACILTAFSKISLAEALHCSLQWDSCSQLRLSACSCDVSWNCWTPTQPLLLRFTWSCLWPRCVLSITLCLPGTFLTLDSLDDLLSHSWECQYVSEPSGYLPQFRVHKESSC